MANSSPNTSGLVKFPKGKSGNPSGKPKNIKTRIEGILIRRIDAIESAMDSASPSELISMTIGLSKLI